MESSVFACMLSVGAIRFEDRFCSSRKKVVQGEVGGCTPLADNAWWPLQLPVEKPWSMPDGSFFCFFEQMGEEMLLLQFMDSFSGILGSF